MIPHLVHVGFPKTGSTSLQNWFAAHPQIAFSRSGFAGSDTIWDFAHDAARTGAVRCRVTSAENLSAPIERTADLYGRTLPMEIPGGQESVCQALAEVFPSAHILIVTRGFGATLRSGYSQLVRAGARFPFNAMTGSVGIDSTSLAYLDYDRFVRLYRARFGDRVIVLPYELLRDDPHCFLSQITSALGLDAGPAGLTVANSSLTDAELEWYPRLSDKIARLPIPAVRKRLMTRHLGWINSGRWRPLLPHLSRYARRPPAALTISDDVLRSMTGYAKILAGEPLYRPYADAYLA